jgi:hypothetical protein
VKKAPVTRRPRRELTPLDAARTKRYASFSRPGAEIWEAASEDGTWAYNRIEEAGTPWAVTHLPTSLEAGQHSSLPNARAATADGRAARDIERQLQHIEGMHQERRNSLCLKC